MCEKCPQEREQITAKYGMVVVAMLYNKTEHSLSYDINLGKTQVTVTLPISTSMADEVECAGFIGAHFNELLAMTSKAFMEREASLQEAAMVADLEAMLRDSPDS